MQVGRHFLSDGANDAICHVLQEVAIGLEDVRCESGAGVDGLRAVGFALGCLKVIKCMRSSCAHLCLLIVAIKIKVARRCHYLNARLPWIGFS